MDYGTPKIVPCSTGMSRMAVSVGILLTSLLGYLMADSPSSLMIGPPPMILDEIDANCWNFTYGNWRVQEFYTPNYPGEYMNNTDCVLYLEAPPGFRIHLDFRDKFVLEKSEGCKYDFLEVRDGPFAYSTLLSRYCGAEFPSIIVSSGRHLWLRFKTDDLLQYGGFRAVYSYHKDHTQNDAAVIHKMTADTCRMPIKLTSDDADGILSSEDIPFTASSDPAVAKGQEVDCAWELYTDRNFRIDIRSLELELKNRKRCDLNHVTIYEQTTLDSAVRQEFCKSHNEVVDLTSRGNRLFVRLYGSSLLNKPKLRITYTLVRTGECSDLEFQCGDLCIPASLVCNGRDNCRDRGDERGCARTRVHKTGSATSAGGTRNVPEGAGQGETKAGGNNDSSENKDPVPLYVIIIGAAAGAVLTLILVLVVCLVLRLRGKKEKRSGGGQVKPLQRNALEMAVCNSSSTNQSLSRQNAESQGGLRPVPAGDRSHHVTFSKVNPVSPIPAAKEANHPHLHHHHHHQYQIPELSYQTQIEDGLLPDQMTDSGHYQRFLSLEPDSIMTDSMHQQLQGKYLSPTGGMLALTALDYHLEDAYKNFHGGQWQPGSKDDCGVYPYSPPNMTSPSPFLGLSKSFSYSQQSDAPFESKYLKAFKAKDNEAINEYQGT